MIGTAATKVCDTEIARTGLTGGGGPREGLRYVTAIIESTNAARLLPGRDR